MTSSDYLLLPTVVWHEFAAVGVACPPTLFALDNMLVQISADLVLAEAALVLLASSLYLLKLVRVSELALQLCSKFALYQVRTE